MFLIAAVLQVCSVLQSADETLKKDQIIKAEFENQMSYNFILKTM